MSGARVGPPRSPWQDWLARLPGLRPDPRLPAGIPCRPGPFLRLRRGFLCSRRYPFIRDVAFDPGGTRASRINDGLHTACDVEDRLGFRDDIYFLAQSHAPHNRCLRFGPLVAMTPARLAPSLRATALAGRDLHPQDIAGFAQRSDNRKGNGCEWTCNRGPLVPKQKGAT